MNEESIIFGEHGGLVGILTRPDGEARAGLIFPNAGLVPKLGPGRLFVDIARELAKVGVASLRFDHSGIGDSPRRDDERSVFDLSIAEVRDAVQELEDIGIKRIAVFGLCSGAYATRHVSIEKNLDTAFLVNPQDLVPGSDLAAQSWKKRYLTQSIFRPQAWKNLIAGRVNMKRLMTVLSGRPGSTSSVETYAEDIDEVRSQLHDAAARGSKIVFLLSERDPSVDEVSTFLETDLRAAKPEGKLGVQVLPDADHLFLAPSDRAALIRMTTAALFD